MAKLKKGKSNILSEMNVEPTGIAKAVVDRVPGKSSALDLVKEVLSIANEEPIKSLIQMGISTLISQATVPTTKTYHTDSTQSEKAIAPRSPSHELLFKMLNGYDEQIIAKVIPFMKLVPGILAKFENDPNALNELMSKVGGLLG